MSRPRKPVKRASAPRAWQRMLSGRRLDLLDHPLTDRGLEQFLKDYEKVFPETRIERS